MQKYPNEQFSTFQEFVDSWNASLTTTYSSGGSDAYLYTQTANAMMSLQDSEDWDADGTPEARTWQSGDQLIWYNPTGNQVLVDSEFHVVPQPIVNDAAFDITDTYDGGTSWSMEGSTHYEYDAAQLPSWVGLHVQVDGLVFEIESGAKPVGNYPFTVTARREETHGGLVFVSKATATFTFNVLPVIPDESGNGSGTGTESSGTNSGSTGGITLSTSYPPRWFQLRQ